MTLIDSFLFGFSKLRQNLRQARDEHAQNYSNFDSYNPVRPVRVNHRANHFIKSVAQCIILFYIVAIIFGAIQQSSA